MKFGDNGAQRIWNGGGANVKKIAEEALRRKLRPRFEESEGPSQPSFKISNETIRSWQ